MIRLVHFFNYPEGVSRADGEDWYLGEHVPRVPPPLPAGWRPPIRAGRLLIMIRKLAGPRPCALAAILIGATLTASQARGAANSCGPYGDPPATLMGNVVPWCLGGKRIGPWPDSDGTPRYACLYEPASAAPGVKLPLVVYLHPALFSAGSIRFTNLLHYQDFTDLTGDSARHGFIVLAPEGRKIAHQYPFPNHWGIGWDNWYRQFNPAGDVVDAGATYKENVDAAAIDHFVEAAVASGKVDTDRIYLTGWSNGAAMAYIYGLNRPNVAAVAVYSAPYPYRAFDDPCAQEPVTSPPTALRQVQIFNPGLPTMHIHNSCDAAGLCPNGELLAQSFRLLGVGVQDTIINSFTKPADSCFDPCGSDSQGDAGVLSNPLGATLGLANHVRWPFNWTATMLKFFRDHPLSARRRRDGAS